MSDLHIVVTTETEDDYDGVPENTKHICGSIDGERLQPLLIHEDTMSDSVCKQDFRDHLTDLGYTWDTEDGV